MSSYLKRRAFTLIELIAVVVVLGILAAIAVPTFSNVKQSSVEKMAMNSAESVVDNARALAAFDGAALSNTYVDRAGVEIGSEYDAVADTVTISSGGVTALASINVTTGEITVTSSGSGGSPQIVASGSVALASIPNCSESPTCDSINLTFNQPDFPTGVQSGDTLVLNGVQWVAATGNYDASELNGVSFVISSVGDYTSMSMGGSINATLTLAAYDAMQLRYQTQFDPNQGLLSIWDISAATYEVRR